MSQKVKLIKEHIHKSIRSLEIENIRLKRQVEQVENGKIAELNTEIERLKEVCCFTTLYPVLYYSIYFIPCNPVFYTLFSIRL